MTGTPQKSVEVKTPWGTPLEIDPRETIGRSIWTTSLYDLSASEVLFRLAQPGQLHLDIGANIGYMTSLLAHRAGASGEVLAFEPHPTVCERLTRNVERIRRTPGNGSVEVHRFALSDQDGVGHLSTPAGFEKNTGLAHISKPGDSSGVSITLRRLDDVLGDRTAVVAKIDVEGHEAAVLRGSQKLLAKKQLRHVLFEEHGGYEAESFRLLGSAGYTVYQVGWQMSGLRLAELSAKSICQPYEAPNFIATINPMELQKTCQAKGWWILDRHSKKQRYEKQ